MAKALFASTGYVKKKSIISGTVDPDKMLQFIETAQDMHIQNYLGTALYKKIQTLIVNGTITDVANQKYRDLLDDYIKPMLAWFAQSEYIPFAAYTLSEGGLFKHRSDNGDAVDRVEIAGLASRANDKASFYAERFIDFMCDNGNDYPEYNQGSQDMSPDKDTDSFGWFLG
jgi:hypothetical protein|tara:strand:+ start:3209 stop:3721 length:513 start_codon:yes stop_codon:yes gene_type:complete